MGEILIDFFKDYGYWGMFFMAFLSGSIVPIASEVLLVFFLYSGGGPQMSDSCHFGNSDTLLAFVWG